MKKIVKEKFVIRNFASLIVFIFVIGQAIKEFIFNKYVKESFMFFFILELYSL